MKKIKVLILQESIPSYRIPIYNLIADQVQLTIGYTKKYTRQDNDIFKVKKLNSVSLKGVYFIKENLLKLSNGFDVVIFMADLHYVSFCLLPFLPRKFKTIPWTIGIRASYSRRYNTDRKKSWVDYLYFRILAKSEAVIFYMSEALKFWNNKFDEKDVFIAHNTIKLNDFKIEEAENKKTSILFVGSLYKEKKIDELVYAYTEVYESVESHSYTLDIVGDGDEYMNISNYIENNQLQDVVKLHGAIFDENILLGLFKKAIICVSPDQAGLSVLKSMGYGVPYITRNNAITGGERFNIINNYNGVFYNTYEELIEIIQDSKKNPDKYIKMGENALYYYNKNATPQIMAKGVIDAIDYVMHKK